MKRYSDTNIIIEIKKLMLDENITQRQVANKLGVTPQTLVSLLNKKNFSFADAEKILNTFGYGVEYDFYKK